MKNINIINNVNEKNASNKIKHTAKTGHEKSTESWDRYIGRIEEAHGNQNTAFKVIRYLDRWTKKTA
jgi:hypothetical protein